MHMLKWLKLLRIGLMLAVREAGVGLLGDWVVGEDFCGEAMRIFWQLHK